jgi:hypothetical protein
MMVTIEVLYGNGSNCKQFVTFYIYPFNYLNQLLKSRRNIPSIILLIFVRFTNFSFLIVWPIKAVAAPVPELPNQRLLPVPQPAVPFSAQAVPVTAVRAPAIPTPADPTPQRAYLMNRYVLYCTYTTIKRKIL